MKKLLCLLLVLVLLLGLVACATLPQNPVETTAPAPEDSPSGSGGTSPSLNTIEDRSQLLDGKTDEEKAVFLWNGMFDEDSVIGDIVKSGTITLKILAGGTSSSYPLTIDAISKSMIIEEGDGAEALVTFQYEEATTSLKLGDLLDQTTLAKIGYVDGKIIEYSSGGDETYALYAAHTPAEWMRYRETVASDTDDPSPVVEKAYCTVKSFEEAGQNYTVAFSGFTAAGLTAINGSLSGMIELLDQVPTDVTLTATFRRDLLPIEMKMVYVFDEDEGENAPAFSVSFEFTDYNKTKAFSPDLSSYTDVGDLLSVRYLMGKQDALAEAASADFKYASTYEVFQGGESLSASSLRYDITHANHPTAGYSFSMEETGSGDRYAYSEQTIYVNTQFSEYADTMTDAQAKEMLRDFIDVLDTSLARVAVAEKIQPADTYKVYFSEIDEALIADLIEGVNGANADHVTAVEAYALYSETANEAFGQLSYFVRISLTVGSASYTVQYTATVGNVVMS